MADSQVAAAAIAPLEQQQQQPLVPTGVEQQQPQPVAPMVGIAAPVAVTADSLAAPATTTSITTSPAPPPSDTMAEVKPDPTLIQNHSIEQVAPAVASMGVPNADTAGDQDASKDVDADGDAEMSYNEFSEDEGSVFEPDDESPKPKSKTTRGGRKSSATSTAVAAAVAAAPPATPSGPGIPATDATTDPALMGTPSVAKTPKPIGAGTTPKTPVTRTPLNRVRSGRVNKDGTPIPSTLECPVPGCEQKFSGRNPRQSLWHHLKYYATRGLADKKDFEAAHDEAHKQMKRDAEPKGTPIERNRISSADYRKKNPEKAKTSARLSNFRARARKKGITDEKEIEEMVAKWEKEWQEKQAKEASEYFSGILLSAFE